MPILTRLALLFALFFPTLVWAEDENPTFRTTEEILAEYHDNHKTPCATAIFAQALKDNANGVSEVDEERVVRAWAKDTMLPPDVIKQVLQCDEVKSVTDMTTIRFTPIEYRFPHGRVLTINYSTQPKVLKQHLILANKRTLPTDPNSPNLDDIDDTSIYINTDPAWYAIMVVQHGALDNFVGPDKNNTVSMKWIDDNIGAIYPHGYWCTSKSAIALDGDTINQVVHEVVNLEEDTNDYYVAGDVDLQWIAYAEIAMDIALAVVTMGGSAAVSGAIKTAQAGKAAAKMSRSIRVLMKMDDVQDYIKLAKNLSAHGDDIAKLAKNADNYARAIENLEKARKAGRTADVAKYEKQAKEILDAAKKIDPKTTEKTLEDVNKLKKLERESENVKNYKKQSDSFAEIMKYRREMRALRRPQTGNIISRALRTMKASMTGSKKLAKATKTARATMSSRAARFGDILLNSTLKNGARLARFEAKVGLGYAVVAFIADMYDYTSNTSKEFTNGIEFKPLCLLSADDLKGYENVVNYGMWFFWEGNSTDPADDDAAYLQAMDFAAKFFYKLDEFQDKNGAECNIDIYIVRPFIRLDEPQEGKEQTGELYYLIMNDIPWSTAAQFGEQITDVEEWERNQQQLEIDDPHNKYKKPEETIDETQNEETNVDSLNNTTE